MKYSIVYINTGSVKEAEKIAMILLNKRLIACANIFPSKSLYWWKGKISNEKEYILFGKTIHSNVEAIRKEVRKVHSYEIPPIIEISFEPNKEYEVWLKGEII